MENDFILEKNCIINEESTQKHFPWILGIIYNIVVYRWAYVIISQLNSTEKKEFGILPHIVYFILFLILLILQIISVNRAIKREDINYCINGALFYRYTMFPISLLCTICIFVIAIGELALFIACMVVPATIVMAPFIGIIFIIFLVILILLYFALLSPGMLAACYLIGYIKDRHKVKLAKFTMHILLQFIPGINIIDTLYITNKYCKRGKILAIGTAVVTLITIVAAIIIIRIV